MLEKSGYSCVVCSNSSTDTAYALQHDYVLLFSLPPTGHDLFNAQDRPEALYHLLHRERRCKNKIEAVERKHSQN